MSYTLEELAAHHQATGSIVNRYVPESDYKQLQSEHDALAATVEALREVITEYRRNRVSAELAINELVSRDVKTPQQHLRDVRAEAAEKAIQAVLNLPTFTGKKGDWLIKSIAWDEVLPFAKKYAERVKAGE